MLKETDILYENGNFWVCKNQSNRSKGYEVYENGLTHATRRVIVGYTGHKGLQVAKDYADRLAKGI